MTKVILLTISLTGMLALSACTTVKDEPATTHSTTSTTTESVQPVAPISQTTETVRSYQ